MSFTLCPEGGPPRLIRFEALPDGFVAKLNAEQNVLRIDPEYYDALTETEQNQILRTRVDISAATFDTVGKAA